MSLLPKKGYVLVEGHGEVSSAGTLLNRLASEIGLNLRWGTPIRWKDLHSEKGIKRGASYIGTKQDVAALLILCDEDDECPRDRGPIVAGWLAELRLPFPSSVVLLHPEYEVLFLPCLSAIAGKPIDGRPGIRAGTSWDRDSWEARRDVKGWLSRHFPQNRSYKPTLDQLPLTKMIDFTAVRESDLPCFGTLERALRFLNDQLGHEVVYPETSTDLG